MIVESIMVLLVLLVITVVGRIVVVRIFGFVIIVIARFSVFKFEKSSGGSLVTHGMHGPDQNPVRLAIGAGWWVVCGAIEADQGQVAPQKLRM